LAPESRPLRFALAITCLDGRVQRPVVDYMRRRYGVDYVDLITEPGPERALTDPTRTGVQTAIHRNARFSVEGHDAELIAVAAHDDCLGNAADPETRLAQLHAAQQLVTGWDLGVDVIGLWVHMDGKVEEASTATPRHGPLSPRQPLRRRRLLRLSPLMMSIRRSSPSSSPSRWAWPPKGTARKHPDRSRRTWRGGARSWFFSTV